MNKKIIKQKINNNYKYVVWVGSCDDHYVSYERAKEHYDDWIDQGYDDVYLIKETQ